MYEQVLDPVGGSLGLTSIFAALPLITLFVLLGVVRMPAQWASLIALVTGVVVALAVYSMPFGQAVDAAAFGAAFGLFPIMWIVINAIWIYNLTVKTGHFQVLRRTFSKVSDDQRVQAVIIAFSFGALLEALAGFGTPVAITAVMLMALGFRPLLGAAVALVANTAPVAFGAIAIPIVTLAEITGLPKDDLGAMVGRQTPLLALIVPVILIGMVDGMRGVRQAWPAAVVTGVTFAIGQFVCSNYISVELTDIVASLLSAGALVAFLQVWQPSEPLRRGVRRPRAARGRGSGPARSDARGRGQAPTGGLRHRARRDRRVRPLRGDHRRLRGGADTGDQGRAREPHHLVRVAGSGGHHLGGRALRLDLRAELVLRGGDPAADLRAPHAADPACRHRPRAQDLRRSRSTSSSGRSSPLPPCWRLRSS